jgi:hypothetical protein
MRLTGGKPAGRIAPALETDADSKVQERDIIIFSCEEGERRLPSAIERALTP